MYICSRCERKYTDPIERCPKDGRKVVADRTGQVIGSRYTLKSIVGVGGMDSTVWSAWQASTRREVAVKLLPPTGPVPAERFSRGARIASNLNHPNITTVHDYGQTAMGDLYLVMELLKGTDLHRASRRKDLSLTKIVHMLDQVLRALGHAHGRGVVHRDVKLSNLFLAPRDDDPNFVKVLDFGIARYIEGYGSDVDNDQEEVTAANQLCGTPQYMAPEQIGFGKVDARVDLYALGVATFRLLTGEFPFRGTSHELFRHHLQTPPPRIKDVKPESRIPDEISDWIIHGMAKDPEHRFQSADDMRTALARIDLSKTQPIPVVSASMLETEDSSSSADRISAQPMEKRRSKTWSRAMLTGVLVFVVGVIWVRWPSQPTVITLSPDAQVPTPAASSNAPEFQPPKPTSGTVGSQHRSREDAATQRDSGAVSATKTTAKATATIGGGTVTAGSDETGTGVKKKEVPVKPKTSPPPRLVLQKVRLVSVPSNSLVARGTEVLGRTPLWLELPRGNHTLTIKASNHRTVKHRVAIDEIQSDPMENKVTLRRIRRRATRRGRTRTAKRSKVSPVARAKVERQKVREPVRPPKKKTIKIRLLGESGERDFAVPKTKKNKKRTKIEMIE